MNVKVVYIIIPWIRFIFVTATLEVKNIKNIAGLLPVSVGCCCATGDGNFY